MAVFFSGEYIAQVHFHCGSFHCCYGVVQRYAGVAVSSGVDYDAVGFKPNGMNFVDKQAFHIALEIFKFNIGETFAKPFHEGFKGGVAVHLGFSGPLQVEIGAVDDDYLHKTVSFSCLRRFRQFCRAYVSVAACGL